jgi:hypothetical protein
MSAGVLDQLDEAIDALADAAVDDGELDAVLIGLMRARHRLAAVTADVLAHWDASGVWRSDGSRSTATRLARDGKVSLTTAHVELRRARKLVDMPATRAALGEGRVSMDHVDLLGRADQEHRHELFVRDEELLVEQCATLRHAQAVKAVEYWMQCADTATGDSTPPPRERPSRLHASTTFQGTVRLDGLLNRLDGAIVTGELERLEREQYLADEEAGIVRTHSERLAAALVEMATRSKSTPADAQRPKPLFTVLLGDDSFRRLCELGNGQVIAPELLAPYLGVAEMETMLFDGPFTVIAASPARSFTGRLRRVIEVRDQHCQHPSGCDVPAPDCDVDHIVPVTAHGATSQFNGRLECRPHNRDAAKHDHGATPLPERPVTVLDEIRARLRWRYLHEDAGGDEDDPDQPALTA